MTNEVFPAGHCLLKFATRQVAGGFVTGQLRSPALTANGRWVVEQEVAGTTMRVVGVAYLR